MPLSFCPMRRKNLKQFKIVGSGDRPLFPPPTVSFFVIHSPIILTNLANLQWMNWQID